MRSNWYYYEHIARIRENLKLIRLKGETIRAINALTIKSLETLDLSVVVPLSREWPGPEIVGNGSSVQIDPNLINGPLELNFAWQCLLIALSCFCFGMNRQHTRHRVIVILSG